MKHKLVVPLISLPIVFTFKGWFFCSVFKLFEHHCCIIRSPTSCERLAHSFVVQKLHSQMVCHHQWKWNRVLSSGMLYDTMQGWGTCGPREHLICPLQGRNEVRWRPRQEQVWRPRVRTWNLTEANALNWRNYLWHCWDISAIPSAIRRSSLWFGTRGIVPPLPLYTHMVVPHQNFRYLNYSRSQHCVKTKLYGKQIFRQWVLRNLSRIS